jgi:hypothetical protein
MKLLNRLKDKLIKVQNKAESKTNALTAKVEHLENTLTQVSKDKQVSSHTTEEATIPKELENTPWVIFDTTLEDAKSQNYKYIQWITSTTPCPRCEALGVTDNFGKGKGIYPISSAPKLRERIHKGCTCIISEYRPSDHFPPIETYWTRDPKTGKGIYVKAKHY